jgi:hypothetical protein
MDKIQGNINRGKASLPRAYRRWLGCVTPWAALAPRPVRAFSNQSMASSAVAEKPLRGEQMLCSIARRYSIGGRVRQMIILQTQKPLRGVGRRVHVMFDLTSSRVYYSPLGLRTERKRVGLKT